MNKIMLVAALFLAVVACDDAPSEAPKPPRDNQASWCHYYKDKRTEVCFVGDGGEHLGHDHSHLSAVPCTEVVERLVEPWPSYNN